MATMKRTVMLGTLAALALAPALAAQIPGMPLFTNPRYGTGIRIHADMGQATDSGTSIGDATVVQGGLSFALGSFGLGANVGARFTDVEKAANNCTGCDASEAVTGSLLAQLRIAGGGRSNMSLSLFGGASMDLKATEFSNTTPAQDSALAFLGLKGDGTKALTIPVGAALGIRIPLGIASLNLWGAPRMNLTKYINCPAGNTAACDADPSMKFRWAVGADFPIFRVLSIRASYDSGKEEIVRPDGTTRQVTQSVWGIGASIGIGGMR